MKLTIPLSLLSPSPPVPNTSSLMNNCYTPLHLTALAFHPPPHSSSLCPLLSTSSVFLSIHLPLSSLPSSSRLVSLRSFCVPPTLPSAQSCFHVFPHPAAPPLFSPHLSCSLALPVCLLILLLRHSSLLSCTIIPIPLALCCEV